jgi:hypothetical protein
MNLKEAFRYQNRLQAFLDTANSVLSDADNITQVTKTHLRHKVMAEVEDETIVDVPPTEYHEHITQLALFLVHLLREKETLSYAIRKAKAQLDIDMDSEVSLNAARQSVANTFKRMNDLRSSEQTISNGGTGYRFNAEGNQISYRCDVKRVTTINFDRNFIRRELGKLNRASDETSAKLDLGLVTSRVEYEPPFDVNSSFTEAFEAFMEKAGA